MFMHVQSFNHLDTYIDRLLSLKYLAGVNGIGPSQLP
jgi:hypothetical protein